MRNKNAKVSDPNSFVTCSGDTEHIEYAPKVMSDGSIELVVSGKTNIDEYINAQRDSTDMAYIITQIGLGNKEVLNQKTPNYGDFTEMPKTFAEALQLKIDAEEAFYDLPLDVRNKFENDFNRFFATAGTQEWYEKINPPQVEEKGEVESTE